VHSQSWPGVEQPLGSAGVDGDASMLEPVCEVLAAVRRAKTEAKSSQKAGVSLLIVRAPAALHARISSAEVDLRDAGSIAEVRYEQADSVSCTVVLAEAI
jgi:valyl-tRNA synthetase